MNFRTFEFSPDPVARAAAVASLGRRPMTGGLRAEAVPVLEELTSTDPDPRVRMAALGTLVRVARQRAESAWRRCLSDDAPAVRARACELAPRVRPRRCDPLISALSDSDPLVAEAAAFALGELGRAALRSGGVAALAGVAGSHPDSLVREAAVAALGSLGDPAGLSAVVAACSDRPAVRRRAVLALAAFEGPEVEAALEKAGMDRDWQVRQAAEDLRRSPCP